MDIKDPSFDTITFGTEDNPRVFKIRNGGLVEKPPCCDCEARAIDCLQCPDSARCISSPRKCKECQFKEECDEDFLHGMEPLKSLMGVKHKVNSDPDPKDRVHIKNPPNIDTGINRLAWRVFKKAKSYHINLIDNGLLLHYEVDDVYHRRFFPDNESLSRFINGNTD